MSARVFVGSAVAAGLVLAGMTHGHGNPVHAFLAEAGSPPVSGSGGSVNANVALGQALAARDYGWTGSQWDCLHALWQGESGWSQYADTRASGLDPANAQVFAYGIPQARGHGPDVNGVTAPYPVAAANPSGLGGSSDPRAQELWGDKYISDTYGNPCNALVFKRAHNNQGY